MRTHPPGLVHRSSLQLGKTLTSDICRSRASGATDMLVCGKPLYNTVIEVPGVEKIPITWSSQPARRRRP
jgi:hypothetical protein